MKPTLTFLTALLLAPLAVLHAANAPAKPKSVPPEFAPVTDDPKLPRVLIIGDSVSVAYTLAVRKELAGVANVHRPSANCGSTKTALGSYGLERWLAGENAKWDVIHFNHGLHDLSYRFADDKDKNEKGEYASPTNGGHQNVPPAEYEKNLRKIIARLKLTGAKLIFATTTPVPESDAAKYVKDSEQPYNDVAKKVMAAEGVAVNDLWALVKPQLEKLQIPRNVHFQASGSAVLAKQVAQSIATALMKSHASAGVRRESKLATVRSPDGRVTATVELDATRPVWSVTFAGKRIVQNGVLGVETTPQNFSGSYSLVGTDSATGDTTWKPVWGFLSQVRDHYNELTFKLQEIAASKRRLDVVLRAYNEGVAVRYVFPRQPAMERVTVKKLLTEFRFTGDHVIYNPRDYQYGNATIATMKNSEGAVTVAVDDDKFVSLTDADRADFSVVSWGRKKDTANTLVAATHSSASGTLPFKTSWQAMVVAETAGKLVENRHLIENLNPPCVIADTSWIKPGKAICQVYNTRMVTDEIKRLMDFGSAHGFDYLEIDHSWSGAETKWTPEEIANFEKNKGPFWDAHPEWRDNVKGGLLAPAKGYVPFRPNSFQGGNPVDLDVPALTAYGKNLKHPIGMCFYVRGALLKEFGGEHAIEDVFACYEKWGVAGVKPGFVPPSSQQNERAIAYMVKKAAEHKLIAVIHDAFLPYGLCRTYPNLVNVEGVAGEEAEPSIAPEIKSLHDILLPFTRGIMGSFDYTPQIYKKSKTHCHQVAMLGVYLGRASVRAGMKQWSPGGEGGAEIEFAEKMPGLTDEIKVSTDLGKYVTVARRRGDNWFVASMSGPKAASYPLPLSFLAPGKTYHASIYCDTPGDRKAAHAAQQVTSRTVMSVVMEPNGGHLMIIEPSGQLPAKRK